MLIITIYANGNRRISHRDDPVNKSRLLVFQHPPSTRFIGKAIRAVSWFCTSLFLDGGALSHSGAKDEWGCEGATKTSEKGDERSLDIPLRSERT